MNSSEAFMQLALETLSCNQKDLALRVGVSPTQISKWKQGEYMSPDMEEKFRALVNIGSKHPEFVVRAGTLEAADKWEKLIYFLAENAEEDAETGYNTAPLSDEPELLCWLTFDTLVDMGVDLPRAFPAELDIDYQGDPNEEDSDEANDNLWELIHGNPSAELIHKLYKSFTNVHGFYSAYVYDLLSDDGLDLWGTVGDEIDSCLLNLAASKLDLEEVKGLATKFQDFRYRVREDYTKWLTVVKETAFRAGAPLGAELLNMVYRSDEELGHEAERESLGFNSSQLHPDIYMNELLVGMRTIHQVLPAIMKKLGIYDEFKLDDSELSIH